MLYPCALLLYIMYSVSHQQNVRRPSNFLYIIINFDVQYQHFIIILYGAIPYCVPFSVPWTWLCYYWCCDTGLICCCITSVNNQVIILHSQVLYGIIFNWVPMNLQLRISLSHYCTSLLRFCVWKNYMNCVAIIAFPCLPSSKTFFVSLRPLYANVHWCRAEYFRCTCSII